MSERGLEFRNKEASKWFIIKKNQNNCFFLENVILFTAQ